MLAPFFSARFWSNLRREKVPQNKDGKGKPFTMHQLRFLFNGARIPGAGPEGIDKVNNYFKTGKFLNIMAAR